jgi:hypothetical protein
MPAIQLPLALAQRLVLRRQGRGSKPSPRSTRPYSPRRSAGGREADAGRLRALRDGYASRLREQATPVRQRQAEALGLKRRLADLVNQAYGLTTEDVELLWRTAPPRMPVGKPGEHVP